MDLSSPCPFIDDGYTEPGFIAEEPRMHAAVRFEYRPVIQTLREQLVRTNTSKPAEAGKNTAKLVASRIVSWDLKDRRGEPVPVTPENLAKLRPLVYEKLSSIVLGLASSDPDPEATAEEEAQAEAVKLAAKEQGITVGEARAQADAKN